MVQPPGIEEQAKQPPLPHTGDVLRQRRSPPRGPAAMAVGGLLFVVAIGYFTIFAKSKPMGGAGPSERAKIAAGTPDAGLTTIQPSK